METYEYDCYISGPISSVGDLELNLLTFEVATDVLRRRGFTVFSPPENESPDEDRPWASYLRKDLPYLCRSEQLVLLPGWEDSRGALLEWMVALELGMPISTYNEFLRKAAACSSA